MRHGASGSNPKVVDLLLHTGLGLRRRGAWARVPIWAAAVLAGAACVGGDSSESDGPIGTAEQEATAQTCVTIQRGGAGAVADAYLHSGMPNANFGGASQLPLGPSSAVLVRFDLSPIPPGVQLTRASLSLRNDQGSGAPVRVHRATKAWAENTVTWGSFGGSFDPQVDGAFNATIGFHNVELLADVQAWYAGAANDGFYIESSAFSSVYSSEAAGSRPSLRVCWSSDEDGDGFVAPADCDDHDASVHPGALEICDGKDNNCDGLTDENDPGGGVACSTGQAGVCGAGTTACTAGSLVCKRNVAPSAETCDGLDNDCNGQIDDNNPGGGASCSTGLAGVCGAGVTTCTGGSLACNPIAQPSPEACDGLDNDCNGLTDEGNPGGGGACSTGAPGVCAAGTLVCSGGALACQGSQQASAETCDGLDNDCNGQVDDNNPGGGNACSTGQQGVCAAGITACANGAIVCNQSAQATSEACDGLDNDCDGQVDEGNPGGGNACSTGQQGVCAAGTTACTGGSIACNRNVAPSPEVCDGLDNNCNGLADEGNPGGGAPCNTGLPGVCAAGITACTNGAITCVPSTQPSAEVCDGLDNDCNGQIDNGNPGGGAACSTGLLGVCSAGTTACSSGSIHCNQNVQATSEVCGDAKDNDCDGQTDEGCVCAPFSTASCYSGPAATAGVGLCHAGTKTCNAQGSGYGPCSNEVIPSPTGESCHTQGDDDCDGLTNEGCAALTCALFTEDFEPNGNGHTVTTANYKSSWCNQTPSPSFNMPLCFASGAGMRTNGSATSSVLWVSRGTSSCTGVKISYGWYQFAQSTSSLQYRQSNDVSANCGAAGSFTTIVPASSQTALQQCSSTNNITIPFGASTGVYIKFNNANGSNNAMWYDNVVVQMVGCDC